MELFKDLKTTLPVLENPEFEKAEKVHDWRNHVPTSFIDAWSELTLREKQIICTFAEHLAENKEWD